MAAVTADERLEHRVHVRHELLMGARLVVGHAQAVADRIRDQYSR
jgi:hypothetical protein